MARTFTITQEGESREFTVATGVGPPGSDAEVTLSSVRAAVPNMVEVAAPTENDFIQRGPSGWLTKTIAQVKTALGLGTAAYTASTDYATALGADDNYVTDAEKTKLSNLSGTNTGDQDLSGYAPLASPTFTGTVTAPIHQATTTAGMVVKNSAGVTLLTIGKLDAGTGLSSGVAEGYATTASGSYSHAEGSDTTAAGYASHAEGYATTASGAYSHAEGGLTTASGSYSHAEGRSTTASGSYSHAGGRRAKATLAGSRVITDSQDADETSTLTDQLTYRFQNGYQFKGGAAVFSGAVSGSNLSGTNTGDQDLSGLAVKSANLSDLASASTARTNLGLGTLATQSGTFSGTSSGTNTGDETGARIATALNAGTEDSTAADTDRIAVVSPAGGWMALSTLWTWITGKIDTLAKLDDIVADATLARTDAGQTFAGAQTFANPTIGTGIGVSISGVATSGTILAVSGSASSAGSIFTAGTGSISLRIAETGALYYNGSMILNKAGGATISLGGVNNSNIITSGNSGAHTSTDFILRGGIANRTAGNLFQVQNFTQPVLTVSALTGTGNVGIGTATPAEKLSVEGNATVSGSLTVSGSTQFASTTRPTSSGTGTPAATSLITLTDAQNEGIWNIGRVFRMTTTSAVTSATGNASATNTHGQLQVYSGASAGSGIAHYVFRTAQTLSGGYYMSVAAPLSIAFRGLAQFGASCTAKHRIWLGIGTHTVNLADAAEPISTTGIGMEFWLDGSTRKVRLFYRNAASATTFSDTYSLSYGSNADLDAYLFKSDGVNLYLYYLPSHATVRRIPGTPAISWLSAITSPPAAASSCFYASSTHPSASPVSGGSLFMNALEIEL